MEEYYIRFMALSFRDHSLMETQQMQLCHTISVEEYCSCFMALSFRDHSLTETQ
jgi:hypothetical protein